MKERGNPLSTVTQVMSQCTTTNNLLKARTQHATQGGTMTKLGLLKSGKLINRWMIEKGTHEKTKHVILEEEESHDRTGQPVVASWARTHEFQSSFSHDKTKHVILEEEESHHGTGQPVVCPQRGAMPQQFIIGDDEAELELSLGSRSFLNTVNDQVRK